MKADWMKLVKGACGRALMCLTLSIGSVSGAESRDYVVPAQVAIEENPFALNLSWPAAEDAAGYRVFRKTLEEAEWQDLGPAGATGFRDTTVAPGMGYEYKIEKSTAQEYTGYGYLYAGARLPLVEDRGTVLLIIEASIAEALGPEIDVLEMDLIGDGWRVLREVVQSSDAPPSVKERIRAHYHSELQLNSVLLLGNVPVPYSGRITPDEHPNHLGAWPADAYYADMDSEWTDEAVDESTAERSRNWNVPGDGKFDQSFVPSAVELMVGRVDLSRMTCFSNKTPPASEVDLTRRYLAKNHRFRHAHAEVGSRALIFDNFGGSSQEPLSSGAWRTFAATSGSEIDVIGRGEYFPYASTNTYLWSAVISGGNYTFSDSVGSADLFAHNTVNVVFSQFLGSYFGDWDVESNFLRAALGANGLTLASLYSGKPRWICQHMALGKTLGFAVKRTQENGPEGPYLPVSVGAGQVHIALHGDPTLRANYIAPVRNLTGQVSDGAMTLRWDPPAGMPAHGYIIYRADSAKGPYQRLVPDLWEETEFTDSSHAEGSVYQVKAAALTITPSGSYWNSSQGAFHPNPLSNPSSEAPPEAPRNVSVASLGQGRVTISWLPGSANHAGFKIERSSPNSGGFIEIASVSAEATSFQDESVPLDRPIEYRIRSHNAAGASAYSNTAVLGMSNSSAAFLASDWETDGDWRGIYGSEGHDVFHSVSELPDYVKVTVRDATLFSAGGSTTDRRALFRTEPWGHWFTCWYSFEPFAIDLAFTDGALHQLAFYTVDWDRRGRAFNLEVVDTFTGQRLDYREVRNFGNGVYFVYALSGNVSLRFTPTTPWNIPVLGIFFDEAKVRTPVLTRPGGTFNGKTSVGLAALFEQTDYHYTLNGTTPTRESPRYTGPLTITESVQFRARGFRAGLADSDVASADYFNTVVNRIGFIRWDDQTRGNWAGTYGSEGALVAPSLQGRPDYSELRLRNASEWTWQENTDDARALLQSASAGNRVASCWYSAESMNIDLSVFDPKSRSVALYFLDWDSSGREQRVELIDSIGQVVDQYTVKDFANGRYLVLNVQGICALRITRVAGPNAVLNGIFWDPAPAELNAPAPVPLQNTMVEHGILQFTIQGQPGQRICVDISEDLREWECTETYDFHQTSVLVTRAIGQGTRAEFMRTHFVEE